MPRKQTLYDAWRKDVRSIHALFVHLKFTQYSHKKKNRGADTQYLKDKFGNIADPETFKHIGALIDGKIVRGKSVGDIENLAKAYYDDNDIEDSEPEDSDAEYSESDLETERPVVVPHPPLVNPPPPPPFVKMPGSVLVLPPAPAPKPEDVYTRIRRLIKEGVSEFESDNPHAILEFIRQREDKVYEEAEGDKDTFYDLENIEKRGAVYRVKYFGEEFTSIGDFYAFRTLQDNKYVDYTYAYLSKYDERIAQVKHLTPEKRFLQYVKWAEEMGEFVEQKNITTEITGIEGSRNTYNGNIRHFVRYFYGKYKEDRAKFMEEYSHEKNVRVLNKFYKSIAYNYDIYKDFKSRAETPAKTMKPAGVLMKEKMEEKPERITTEFVGTVKTIAEVQKIKDKLREQDAYDFIEQPSLSDDLGVNKRGDVINSYLVYQGHYDFKTKKFTKRDTTPEDWEYIIARLKSL